MNKYSKCVGVSLGLDLAYGGVAALAEKQGGYLVPFLAGSIISLIISTLPAIGANVLDKYVNPNISDNKYFQYGATALEAGLINVGVGEAFYSFNGDYITALTSSEFSLDSCLAKLFFANAIPRGLLFKWILSEEEANESGAEDEPLFGNNIKDELNNDNEVNDNSNSNGNESVVGDDDINNNNISVTPDYC